MSDIANALSTVAVFDELDSTARRALAAPLARALGADFEAHDQLVGASELVAVRHRPTGLLFIAIPGGSFDMGLTEEDIEEAATHVAFTKGVQGFVATLTKHARPTRRVRVAPFLCASTILSGEHVVTLGRGAHARDTFSAAEVLDFIDPTGFRLPSEAELEYLARDGGALHFTYDAARAFTDGEEIPDERGFGVRHLLTGQWCRDAWHDDYQGAPATSEPWSDRAPPGVYRGALPFGVDQSDDEVLYALAAFRGRAARAGEDDDGSLTFFGVRLVRDLPG